MEIYSLENSDFTRNANVSKEALLKALERDGVIVSAKELSEKYAVVWKQKGIFGTWWDKFTNDENHEGWAIQVVKRV